MIEQPPCLEVGLNDRFRPRFEYARADCRIEAKRPGDEEDQHMYLESIAELLERIKTEMGG